MIRLLRKEDFDQVKQIHEKYYKHEFNLNDFYKAFIDAFVIEENGEIIVAGGVRCIAESLAITNKDFSVRKRRKALLELLEISLHVTEKNNFDQLHCFVQDDSWEKILKEYQFRDCKGKALVIEVK